ncbi:MAG: aminomethyltransferase beta-barrel domain-containing protein, partial [Eggerthella sp.]
RSRPCACIIEPEDDQRVSLALRSPQPTTAPGQYAVLYDGDTVLGGGMIEEVMHA